MNKWKLLPRMAAKGMLQNGTVYYPYLMAGIFSAFTWFVFSSILCNDLMMKLPRSAYAWMMLSIGRVLLGLILIPFLYYANSFLVKRRTKEIGLYSILGLEKRHIGIMLFCEAAMTYGIVMAGGILLGVVLSKLLFLLLLKLISVPMDITFVFTWKAFRETLAFFAVVYAVNFLNGLIQVGKSRPVELLSGSKKGEKEPRMAGIYAVLGVIFLGAGYVTSIRSQLNSEIFIDFFLAVFWVIIGTYLLFTSGSVMILKLLKKNRKFYYRRENFVTVSGMLYRMKKNAAGLSNICIFSTMVVITLTCTVVLYLGLEELTHFVYPYDVLISYGAKGPAREQMEDKVQETVKAQGGEISRVDIYDLRSFSCSLSDNRFESPLSNFMDNYSVRFLTLEDYNRIEGEQQTLEEGQILFYSEGKDAGFDTLEFMGMPLEIKEEVKNMFPYPKAEKDSFGSGYVVVVRDKEALAQCTRAYADLNGVTDVEGFLESSYRDVGVVLEGEEPVKERIVNELLAWGRAQGEESHRDGLSLRADLHSTYGGLLFIGILFGLIFFMCLLLIMYYKQISEGYEDRGSFEIMQKVGMSHKEIRSTVRRQILLVFFMPLAGALLHTFAGMFMVENLMAALQLFDSHLMAVSAVMISLVFILVYGVSYLTTAKTYYRIIS